MEIISSLLLDEFLFYRLNGGYLLCRGIQEGYMILFWVQKEGMIIIVLLCNEKDLSYCLDIE